MTVVRFVREPWADPDIPAPSYETSGAAGADIRANFPDPNQHGTFGAPQTQPQDTRGCTLAPGERMLVPTGLRVEIPQGYEMQIRPRSGLALKQGISLANAPGTIDADYRGPLGIILINHGSDTFFVEHGARIAQCVIAPVVQARFEEVSALSETSRGGGGFGSTGKA